MTTDPYGFTTIGEDEAGWGIEDLAFKSEIEKAVLGDCVEKTYSALGHLHDKVYNSNKNVMFSSNAADATISIGNSNYKTIVGNDLELYYDRTTGQTIKALYNLSIIADYTPNLTDGSQIKLFTRRDQYGSQALQEVLTVDEKRFVKIGPSTNPSDSKGAMDISFGGMGLVVGADQNLFTRTNNTDKYGYLSTPHYDNSDLPVAAITGKNTSTANILNIGGEVDSLTNAVTEINFYTGPNHSTLNGIKRAWIDKDGYFHIPTLDVNYGGEISFGADNAASTKTDATSKIINITCPNYQSDTIAGVGMITVRSSAGSNKMDIGGYSSFSAITEYNLYVGHSHDSVSVNKYLKINTVRELALYDYSDVEIFKIDSTGAINSVGIGARNYADNAAAVSAGLQVNDFYHTAGVLKIVV